MKIKGVVFDLDDTLLDSSWVWEGIDKKFLGSRGIEIPEDYVDDIAALGFKGAAEYTINRFGLKETPEMIMREWAHMAEDEYRDNVKIKPYVKDFLEYLQAKGIKMSVATASYNDLFMPCLKNNGIVEYFDSFTTVGEVGNTKEEPDVYITAAKKMGFNPSDCIVFEDLAVGLKAAKKAGFTTMAVINDFVSEEEKKNYLLADYTMSNYKELMSRGLF